SLRFNKLHASRQDIHSIGVASQAKSLLLNTLRGSRQNIHSIRVVRKMLPIKGLSQDQNRFGLRHVFKEHCRSRRRPGFATPESDSSLLSLLFRTKLAREENAVRRTKV